jgi:hypothetical protein
MIKITKIYAKEDIMKKIIMLFLIVLISSPLVAVEITKIEIVEYGIYTSEIIGTIYAPLTTSGKYNLVKNVKLVEKTTNIPATKGTKFGLFYIIHGNNEGEEVKITEIIRFPNSGYRDPKTGKRFLKSEFSSMRIIGSKNFVAGTFAEDWDLFPGTWQVELWHKDQKLAEKAFTVFNPNVISK